MMKYLSLFIMLILVISCRRNPTPEVAVKHFPNIPPPPSPQTQDPELTPYQVDENALLGTWKNGSCGERQYLRIIHFLNGGTFKAVDEVAPCPEGTTCISSGVIQWHGTWKSEEKTISITPQPAEGEKLPDQIPTAYVVVSEDPLLIGEQIGSTVCPYRKDG